MIYIYLLCTVLASKQASLSFISIEIEIYILLIYYFCVSSIQVATRVIASRHHSSPADAAAAPAITAPC